MFDICFPGCTFLFEQNPAQNGFVLKGLQVRWWGRWRECVRWIAWSVLRWSHKASKFAVVLVGDVGCLECGFRKRGWRCMGKKIEKIGGWTSDYWKVEAVQWWTHKCCINNVCLYNALFSIYLLRMEKRYKEFVTDLTVCYVKTHLLITFWGRIIQKQTRIAKQLKDKPIVSIKMDKGNAVVVVEKADYGKQMKQKINDSPCWRLRVNSLTELSNLCQSPTKR